LTTYPGGTLLLEIDAEARQDDYDFCLNCFPLERHCDDYVRLVCCLRDPSLLPSPHASLQSLHGWQVVARTITPTLEPSPLRAVHSFISVLDVHIADFARFTRKHFRSACGCLTPTLVLGTTSVNGILRDNSDIERTQVQLTDDAFPQQTSILVQAQE